MSEQYIPQVNDYVIWDKGEYGKEEGWVDFYTGPSEERKGFAIQEEYITIEIGVKPKHKCKYTNGKDIHKMIHTLILCYKSQWHQLKWVKSRESKWE